MFLTKPTSAVYVIGKNQTNIGQLTTQAQAQGYAITNAGAAATTLAVWQNNLIQTQAAAQQPQPPTT